MPNQHSQGEDAGSGAIDPSAFEHFWWRRQAPLFAFLMLAVVLAGTYYLLRPLFAPSPSNTGAPGIPIVSGVAEDRGALDFSTDGASHLYFVAVPPGVGTTDIFSRSMILTGTAPTNITNSVSFSEYSPQPSPDGSQIAFLTVSASGDRSLRVRQPDGQIADLSYQAVPDSLGSLCSVSLAAPPRWNDDGRWIAALVECGAAGARTTKLFAFSTQRSEVIDLSPKANQVREFQWINPTTLVFDDLQPNRQTAIFRVSVNQPVPEELANAAMPSN